MRDSIIRSVLDILETTGHTATGIAVPFDKPSRVQDLVRGVPGPSYLEAFAPSSADVSIRHHPTVPLHAMHKVMREPIGEVAYRRSDVEKALMFEAEFGLSERAEAILSLVRSGDFGAVSIGFNPVRELRRGAVTYRTEIALNELSAIPTGMGQHPDAKVLAVRSELDLPPADALPVLESYRRRLARIHVGTV